MAWLRRKAFWLLAAVAVLALALFLLLRPQGAEPAALSPAADLPAETLPAAPAPSADEGLGLVVISELMSKNKAALPGEDGSFPDWVELLSLAEEPLTLSGWRLSDGEGKAGWQLPELTLEPGLPLLLYADGRGEGLHASFSLSEGETVCLYNAAGTLIASAPCLSNRADAAVQRLEDGSFAETLYPTPGFPNGPAGYDAWQESRVPAGPLVIHEVVVSNREPRWDHMLGGSDWVELKNISDEPLLLSDFCLSDDADEPGRAALPPMPLQPGELFVIRCDVTAPLLGSAPICTAFNLDAYSEQLYLSRADGELIDCAALRDIPFGGSYGRLAGEAGWFYFAEPSPGDVNRNGFRRVSAAPTALSADGIFENVKSAEAAFAAAGTLYYTTDGSYPTENSAVYTGPITVESTGIVRAVSVEEGALPSRPLTLCYLLNEGHSLPVVSLVSDNHMQFWQMYNEAMKGVETPGSISFYDENGSFTAPCGIKMHGDTSLVLSKKNMAVQLRGVYGQESVTYDVYGGGVTEFSAFVLRAGQDYNRSIIRNELCENLALAASDRVVSQRNRYCIVYVDGEYYGIYALTEKLNEAMYARLRGVSKSSVTTITSEVPGNTDLYEDVFLFCQTQDLSLPENYEELCRRLDVDSLIDWIILEGWCANGDLTYGNLRYCRSTEDDGKWRLMFYDMDSTLTKPEQQFTNILGAWPLQTRQVSELIAPLLENADFRDRLLRRAGELLRGPLSDEAVLAEIDRLAETIDGEVERDYARYGMRKSSWEWNIAWLKDFIAADSWQQHGVDALCELFELDEAQRSEYFGA